MFWRFVRDASRWIPGFPGGFLAILFTLGLILAVSGAAAVLVDGVTVEMSAGAVGVMILWAVVDEILLRSGTRRRSR